LFWFCPAKSLRGILPGVLDKWDQAYNEHISAVEGAARCDCDNDEWMTAYTAYAKAVIMAYETAAQTATFITVPQRAVARLRFFLLGMTDFHSASIFPMASVIKEELESRMKAVEFAFADVSSILISSATTQHLRCRDNVHHRMSRQHIVMRCRDNICREMSRGLGLHASYSLVMFEQMAMWTAAPTILSVGEGGRGSTRIYDATMAFLEGLLLHPQVKRLPLPLWFSLTTQVGCLQLSHST
jgi:hypothetical protein